MFESFSDGYYFGKLYLEPADRELPAIQQDDHERMNAQLYGDDGVIRVDAPLVMKIDTGHLPVVGDASVPTGTLSVPRSINNGDLPAERSVLVAKSDRARELLRYAGYRFGDDAAVT